MSFSEKIKNEILMTKNKKCCILPLRYGELITEARAISVLELKKTVINKCCKKAFLKGVFLGSGCVIDPNKDYHFEVTVKAKVYATYVINILAEFGINAKYIKRANGYVVYIKDSDNISMLLAIFNANSAMLEYENIRINKAIKNDINRSVNCETANLNKVVEAAVKQEQAINKLKKDGKFSGLDERLRTVANLRLKYPDASLDELVQNCTFKISKSGLYHRLNKIVKLAEEK